jgi:hypothetical protein
MYSYLQRVGYILLEAYKRKSLEVFMAILNGVRQNGLIIAKHESPK